MKPCLYRFDVYSFVNFYKSWRCMGYLGGMVNLFCYLRKWNANTWPELRVPAERCTWWKLHWTIHGQPVVCTHPVPQWVFQWCQVNYLLLFLLMLNSAFAKVSCYFVIGYLQALFCQYFVKSSTCPLFKKEIFSDVEMKYIFFCLVFK